MTTETTNARPPMACPACGREVAPAVWGSQTTEPRWSPTYRAVVCRTCADATTGAVREQVAEIMARAHATNGGRHVLWNTPIVVEAPTPKTWRVVLPAGTEPPAWCARTADGAITGRFRSRRRIVRWLERQGAVVAADAARGAPPPPVAEGDTTMAKKEKGKAPKTLKAAKKEPAAKKEKGERKRKPYPSPAAGTVLTHTFHKNMDVEGGVTVKATVQDDGRIRLTGGAFNGQIVDDLRAAAATTAASVPAWGKKHPNPRKFWRKEEAA